MILQVSGKQLSDALAKIKGGAKLDLTDYSEENTVVHPSNSCLLVYGRLTDTGELVFPEIRNNGRRFVATLEPTVALLGLSGTVRALTESRVLPGESVEPRFKLSQAAAKELPHQPHLRLYVEWTSPRLPQV